MTIHTRLLARPLIFALCALLTLSAAPTTLFAGAEEGATIEALEALDLAESPSFGEAEAPVTIIVFSDYQCPFCKRAEDTLIEIKRAYGDDVRVVYKQFPLPFHKQAIPAAKAALAAHAQGKFELMHRKLFSKNESLGKVSDIDGYMVELASFMGLDVEQFKKDYTSEATAALLEQDKELVNTLGVRGTPNFFVNGIQVIGAQPIEQFKEVIDPELATSKALIKDGRATGETIHATRFTENFAKEVVKRAEAKAAANKKDVTVHHVPVEKADPVYGNRKDALVTIVVFSDFECPFCSRAATTMQEVQTHYGKKEIRVVFKHLPLPFHKRAKPAARAAVAAHAQGKFWAMHDHLFDDQQGLKAGGSEYFISLANKLDLDVKQFEKDLDSTKTRDKVEADMALAAEVGARGTPNFFINGIQVTGAQSADTFKGVIDEQLELARGMKKKDRKLEGETLYKKLVEHNAAHATPPEKKVIPDTLTPKQLETLRGTKSSDVLGDREKARVVIYEFTDLQCPFCKRADATMLELHDRYGDDLAIVTFHFPLPFHKQAEQAAQAVIAAGKQGKAHAMRQLIFAHQQELKSTSDLEAHFAGYAKELGLDVKQFKKDYSSTSTAQKVDDDMALGSDLGVRGTPHFFVEDRRISGAQPLNKFEAMVDDAMRP